MPRARGSSFSLFAKTESSEGTAPSGDWVKLPVYTFNLGRSQPITTDAVLSVTSNRDSIDPFLGEVSMSGQARVPIDSKNFGHWLKILLGAPSTSDDEDAGAGNYIHLFTSGTATLPTKSFEKAMAPSGKYFVINGVKANSMTIDFSPPGAADATFDLIGEKETDSGSSAAGSPTTEPFIRFRRTETSLTMDGDALGNVTGGTFTYSNNLDPARTVRNDETFDGIDEGEATLEGSLKVRFTDATLLHKGTTYTPVALEITMQAGSSALIFEMPRIFLGVPVIGVEGPGGVEVTYPFRAARDTSAGYMMQIIDKNQTSGYP